MFEEKQVYQQLDAKIIQIVQGALARIPASQPPANPLQAYTFEQFDLNGDGTITTEEFDEARRTTPGPRPP